jgi:hypothetical protein
LIEARATQTNLVSFTFARACQKDEENNKNSSKMDIEVQNGVERQESDKDLIVSYDDALATAGKRIADL